MKLRCALGTPEGPSRPGPSGGDPGPFDARSWDRARSHRRLIVYSKSSVYHRLKAIGKYALRISQEKSPISPSGVHCMPVANSCRKFNFCTAHAMGRYLFTIPFYLLLQTTSPSASFTPRRMFMFWIAAPDAPLPRLSNLAMRRMRSSLPHTVTSMSSLPESAPAE